MYKYMYVYIYTYIHIHIRIYQPDSTSNRTISKYFFRTAIFKGVYSYIQIHTYTYTYKHVYIHKQYIYTYTYTYTYIYICTNLILQVIGQYQSIPSVQQLL
jgi:hypothetical protein